MNTHAATRPHMQGDTTLPVANHERMRQREALLAAVERIKPALEAGGALSETQRTLPADAVAALRNEGLFTLKVPAELGGVDADPVTQMHVYEAVARIDPAAGWTCFIGCGAMVMTGFLPDACIEDMWAGGRIPTAAGVVMPGHAKREAGGYRIDGHWSWGSGINHAEWVGVHVLVDNDGAPPDSVLAMLPAAQVEILDNWHVAGPSKARAATTSRSATASCPQAIPLICEPCAPCAAAPRSAWASRG